jgi:hypothetical protein
LSDNNLIFSFATDSLKSPPISNFTKIRPVGAGLLHANSLTKNTSKWRSTEIGILTSNKCSAIVIDRVYDDRCQLTSTYVSSQGHINGILGTMVLATQTGCSKPRKRTKNVLVGYEVLSFLVTQDNGTKERNGFVVVP